jgi:two-component system, LuxR family, sensor kinase FixL
MNDGTVRADALGLSTDAVTFYRTLVENALEGIMTIDADHRIVYANSALEDILGYSRDELVGSSKLKIIPERLRPVHTDALESYLRTDETNADWEGMELSALHKDGHEVPTLISLHEHEHDGSRLFTGIVRDLSDHRERERELRRRNERLDDFAEIVSHDIKTPLSVAKGYTELARECCDAPELEEVDAALDRIEELVDDVLALSRGGDTVGDTELVPLDHSIREVWARTGTNDATLRIENELRVIRADRSRFRELLTNVFRNAVTHAGADVALAVGRLDDEPGFYLEDDGPGVPAAIREDVFEHGYSTHEEGTGYGLSIVDRIASAHGWHVDLTDGRDGGARFEIAGVSFVE